MVTIAIKCPLNGQMIYSDVCENENKRRGCENFVCKPLRDVVGKRQQRLGALEMRAINTIEGVRNENTD